MTPARSIIVTKYKDTYVVFFIALLHCNFPLTAFVAIVATIISHSEVQHRLPLFSCLQVQAKDLDNPVINACFLLLFKDLIKLYACYNDGIINLLGEKSLSHRWASKGSFNK